MTLKQDKEKYIKEKEKELEDLREKIRLYIEEVGNVSDLDANSYSISDSHKSFAWIDEENSSSIQIMNLDTEQKQQNVTNHSSIHKHNLLVN